MASENIIIVGGGPAGIAAAIQLKRTGWNPVIFEKNRLGGLLNNANLVENYPGFPKGISGLALVSLFKKQLTFLKIEVIFGEVRSLDFIKNEFVAETDGVVRRSRAAILASGTCPKRISKVKMSENVKNRLLYEIVGLENNKNRNIVIIGGSDAAFDYALNLARRNKVTILNRSADFKCLPLLYDRAKKNNSIDYFKGVEVKKISENDSNKLLLNCSISGRKLDIGADFVILAIGRRAEFGFISDRLKGKMKILSKDGLFCLVGDVAGGIYRQSTIAVGEGIEAAMKLDRRLRGLPV